MGEKETVGWQCARCAEAGVAHTNLGPYCLCGAESPTITDAQREAMQAHFDEFERQLRAALEAALNEEKRE